MAFKYYYINEFRDKYHNTTKIPVVSAKFLCVLGYPCSSIVYNTKSLAGQELLGHTSVSFFAKVLRILGRPQLLHAQPPRKVYHFNETIKEYRAISFSNSIMRYSVQFSEFKNMWLRLSYS